MIEKVISGGQTGVEHAALDAAIRVGLAYGGWIPRWRRIENEVFVRKYQLKEMPNSNYFQATQENILDSDGTLIISQGELTTNCALNRRLAKKHNRPCIYIDLGRVTEVQSAQVIESWIKDQGIKILNVTGPKQGKGLDIYETVSDILETTFKMAVINFLRHGSLSDSNIIDLRPEKFLNIPKTVDKTADVMLSKLSFKEKTKIANVQEKDLFDLTSYLRAYVKSEFRFLESNESLKEYYNNTISGTEELEDMISMVIMELWQKLQHTDNVLRVVK